MKISDICTPEEQIKARLICKMFNAQQVTLEVKDEIRKHRGNVGVGKPEDNRQRFEYFKKG